MYINQRAVCQGTYSHLPNKRAGRINEQGGDFLQKSLNEQGENMPNKRACRNFS